MLQRADRQRPIAEIAKSAHGGGPTTSLRLVHPGSLPVTAYRTLAAALPPSVSLILADLERIPAYWRAALDGDEPQTTIDELARHVQRALPAPAHDERVVLGGWSFGGVVAYAAARHPTVAPERLILLDSIAPADEFKHAEDTIATGEVLRWFAMYLAAKRGVALPLALDALERVDDAETGVEMILGAATASGALHRDTSLAGILKVYRTYLAGLRRNQRLADAYDAAPVSVPLELVRPDGSLMPDSQTLGWDDLAGAGLRVHGCDGDHYSMLKDPSAVALVADLVGAHEGGAAAGATFAYAEGRDAG